MSQNKHGNSTYCILFYLFFLHRSVFSTSCIFTQTKANNVNNLRRTGPTYSSTKEQCSLEGVMYPGQVIRSALYGGPLGRLRTGETLFDCVIVHEGFPWIKCCSLQTHRSQRTRSFCLMSTMGDKSVRTLIWIRATLDVAPLARRLHVEKESGTGGGGEGDNFEVLGLSNTTHQVVDILEWI